VINLITRTKGKYRDGVDGSIAELCIVVCVASHPRIPRGDFARYIDVESGITPGYPRMVASSVTPFFKGIAALSSVDFNVLRFF